MAGGTYQIANDVTGRPLNARPEIVSVPREDVRNSMIESLAAEGDRDGPGQQVILDRLLDIAMVTTVRAWLARPDAAQR